MEHDRRELLMATATLETSILAIAYVLANFADIDPVGGLNPTLAAVGWGIAITLPMILAFTALGRIPLKALQRVNEILVERLGPMLLRCRWQDLLLIAVLAGVCEEILFRGLIQPWFGKLGAVWGIVGANIIFGLAHAVTVTYAILAAGLGVLLSYSMHLTEEPSLLIPIIAHTLYDFVGLAMVRSETRARQEQSRAGDEAESG